MADAHRNGKTLFAESCYLRRFYKMKSFLHPEIYMDNVQQRMYEITINIPDFPFLNLPRMFDDFIDRVKSENDVWPKEQVQICLFQENSFVYLPFRLGCHVKGVEHLDAIEDSSHEFITPGTIRLTIAILRDN